jgi:predicted enzyme related to lactoylglutathione lyase
MNIQYKHTNIIAENWKALSEFYIQVFGCKVLPPERNLSGEWVDRFTGIVNARIRGVHLSLPGYENGPTLEIFGYEPEDVTEKCSKINRKGFGHIAFHVDDVEAVVEKLLQHGGKMYGEIIQKQYEGIGLLTAVYATDPEGNIIEIQNWKK